MTKVPAHDILFLHLRWAEEESCGPLLVGTMIGRCGTADVTGGCVATGTVVWVGVGGLVGVQSREGGEELSGEEEGWGVTGEEGREGVRVRVESSST